MEWETKGIRGAGSVVRYAYSFGRHSRQPFGDRPRYAADVTSPLYAVASRGSYCACYAIAPQACPTHPHRGCFGCPSARLFQTLETRHRLPSVSPGLDNETRVPRRWTTCGYLVRNTPELTPRSTVGTDTKEGRKERDTLFGIKKSRSHYFDPDSTAC